ncbi:DUF6876 family protein [Methylotuvimicrobium sp.]|uniref:DUF6876 family protein n=1 Tax=Methylotuvimicrobium sp. TaxID=2822413 RepID=UPI003D64A802
MKTMNTQTANNARLDTSEFASALAHFTGTEQWYRHPFIKRMIYTDGVKFFAENGGEHGAYWFLDKMALEACPELDKRKEYFGSVVMKVADDKTAVITVTDGNDGLIATYTLDFTEMQVGEWRFYLIEDGDYRVMLLPSEY